MTINFKKSESWDLLGKAFWNVGHEYIRKDASLIDLMCLGLHPNARCCVIGASAKLLLATLLERKIMPTVIDFSKRMCCDLKEEFPNHQFPIIHKNILNISEGFYQFDYVLSDQILNCMGESESYLAIENLSKLLKNGGELRIFTKLGLYDLDCKLIEYAKRQGSESPFDSVKNIIDYTKAKSYLKKMCSGMELDEEILLSWYISRGQERRYSVEEVKQLLSIDLDRGQFFLKKSQIIEDELFYTELQFKQFD